MLFIFGKRSKLFRMGVEHSLDQGIPHKSLDSIRVNVTRIFPSAHTNHDQIQWSFPKRNILCIHRNTIICDKGILVALVGNDPTSQAYETRTNPSQLQSHDQV